MEKLMSYYVRSLVRTQEILKAQTHAIIALYIYLNMLTGDGMAYCTILTFSMGSLILTGGHVLSLMEVICLILLYYD